MVSRPEMRGSRIVGSMYFVVVGLATKALSGSELMSSNLRRPTKTSEEQGEALSITSVVSVAKIRFDASDLSWTPG